MNLPSFVRNEDDLRAHVPAPGARVEVKIRPSLDATGAQWIAAASLAAVALRRADGWIDVVARARRQGLAEALDEHRVRVDDARDVQVGAARPALEANAFAGAIFVLPGIESTIRANGAAQARDGAIELRVAETYMHCPKAFVRSRLWRADAHESVEGLEAERGAELGAATRRFVERSPFLFLGTSLEDGSADVSPRGDPPGFVRVVDEKTLLIPDRPGNRILDSFRNLLANPVVGLLFLIPGQAWVVRVTGRARLTDDADWLAPMAVRGKAPRLGIWVDVAEAVLEPAPALGAAGIWEPVAKVTKNLPTVGRAIIEQVEPDGRFRAAKGRLLDWMLARDAKKNLY